MTGRADAAADVVQESWLAMVKGLRRLEDPACFPRWAYQIVTRRSADWARVSARHRRVARRAAAGPAVDSDEVPERDDDLDRLRSAIRRLPQDRRTVLTMHYVDGLSVAEIADVLSIPAGTVKSRLHHTRNELRQLLQPPNSDLIDQGETHGS